MGFTNTLLKQVILLAIVFYGLPVFWWTYNSMDDSPDNEYFLSVRFLMSTGSLMASMGMAYIALPFDLVPDWIPILGKIDDLFAKMAFGGGLMMCYMGYNFGGGETPKEFEMVVTAYTTAYDVIFPFLKENLVPLLAPAAETITVPMKVVAEVVLGAVIDKAKDPYTTQTVMNLANKAAEL